MQVKRYSRDTLIGTTPVYSFDPALVLNGRKFYNDENMDFTFSGILSGINDIKVNNFSELILTKRNKLGDFLRSGYTDIVIKFLQELVYSKESG